MYIEYVRNQRYINGYGYTFMKKGNDPFNRFKNTSVSTYRPTWLVRVSDMRVVSGSSVSGQYWALSYSWNQCGELIHRGGEEYERMDDGWHKIIEYPSIQGYTMKSASGRDEITDTDFDPKTASVQLVTFEGLIQQICKDFGIDYIWYDQMCINQGDRDEKMREIKQMHLVYKNAVCTMALVPEFRYTIESNILGRANKEVIPHTQWCKRMWTLEEAYVSKDIVLLGQNVHYWSNIKSIWMASTNKDYMSIHSPRTEWMACTALWYAKGRTSSKAHDRIFALANIFPELMDYITFSYDQPLHRLMIQFYTSLATKDLSILWFGAPLNSRSKYKTVVVQQRKTHVSLSRRHNILKRLFRPFTKPGLELKTSTVPEYEALPSWTGVNGTHVAEYALENKSTVGTSDYTIVGDCLRLTSSYVAARIEPANAVEKPEGFDDPDEYRTAFDHRCNLSYKEYDVKSGLKYQFTEDGLPTTRLERKWKGTITENGSTDLIFVPTSSTSNGLYTADTFYALGWKATHILPLMVKDSMATNTLSEPTHCGGFLSLTEECSKCAILFQPAFKELWGEYKGYPVIKMDKGRYRSIGVFVTYLDLGIDSFFFSSLHLQTFGIN